MELTPELVTQFGLIQKVSTGKPYLDMVLVMLLPLLLKTLLPWFTDFFMALWNKKKEKAEVITRNIEYKKNYDYYWYDSQDGPSNSILQKAIMNFINKHPDVLRQLPDADFQIKKRFIEPKRKITVDDENSDSDEEEDQYDVNALPPLGTWIDMNNGIKFMRNQESIDDKNRGYKTTFCLQSTDKRGVDRIEEFVSQALELYQLQQASKKVDHSRYLYIPVITGIPIKIEDGEASGPSAMYKRYKLSEEKTFASFFHPDKDNIIQLVSQFVGKTGKFGIPGYPQKLGFLLYGPPGTGKTSFIKALAQHTSRSIISIPLTKIRTNQELMDIMMDQKITVQNEDDRIQLPYSKTIFILEDVDAASTVVQRRASEDIEASGSATMRAQIAQFQSSMTPSKSSSKKKSKRDASTGDDSDKEDSKESKPKPMVGFGPSLPYMGRSLFGGEDELNLAGLLNVLDGVVDTPNRIVIMTTNHPEKLDPALIRPGRINKKVYMGRICVGEAVSMMEHYYGKMPADEESRLRQVFVDEAMSPAELEAMCAEYDSIPQLVGQLRKKFNADEDVHVNVSLKQNSKVEVVHSDSSLDLKRACDQLLI